MKILIRNGTIITSSENKVEDILIHDGTITGVGTGLSETGTDTIIEAGGKFIFPGGIDPHVHMHLPVDAGFSSDDFYSGSIAALCGGTTTLIDFVTPLKGESLPLALEKRKEEAKNALTDYSFHVSPVEWKKTTADEIKECLSKGVSSFKVYMAYKNTVGLADDDILKVMQAVGGEGGTVTVHCELGDEIEVLRNKYYCERYVEPFYHHLSRPPEAEAEAVARAVELAEKASCSLYIVHVSAEESLKHIRAAQARGQRVYAETCPQYLLLDDSKYRGDFNHTAPYVMSPPLRSGKDCDALWDALADGTINTIGTDHCPFTMAQKETGIEDFRKIPGGAGGIEHRLSLLFTYGVMKNRISINRMVDLFSAQPAKIFGLYPRKGDIAVNSDADLVIWDPDAHSTISAKTHHQNCDINIYEGIAVNGNAEWVIAGGRVMIEKGHPTGWGKSGKYLFRTVG
ncbi:MAG TPA: dihydropyrimidinase [Bacteroidales bacterium]|nr:dihydropyrimidinase [Bacteroidales bacterium]